MIMGEIMGQLQEKGNRRQSHKPYNDTQGEKKEMKNNLGKGRISVVTFSLGALKTWSLKIFYIYIAP